MHGLKTVGNDFIPAYCCTYREANTNTNPCPRKKGLRAHMECRRCWTAGNQPQGPGPHGREWQLCGSAWKNPGTHQASHPCEVASCRTICEPTPCRSASSASFYKGQCGTVGFLCRPPGSCGDGTSPAYLVPGPAGGSSPHSCKQVLFMLIEIKTTSRKVLGPLETSSLCYMAFSLECSVLLRHSVS